MLFITPGTKTRFHGPLVDPTLSGGVTQSRLKSAAAQNRLKLFIILRAKSIPVDIK